MLIRFIWSIFTLSSVAGQAMDLWPGDCRLPGGICQLNSEKSEMVVHVHHAHWYTCGLKISTPTISGVSAAAMQDLVDGLVVEEHDQFGVYRLTSTIAEAITFDLGQREALYVGVFSLATKSGESLNQLIGRTFGSATIPLPSVVISEIGCGQ